MKISIWEETNSRSGAWIGTIGHLDLFNVAQRSWTWGKRCEIRIWKEGVNPSGLGYKHRCLFVAGDYDRRHQGPKSLLGKTLNNFRKNGFWA